MSARIGRWMLIVSVLGSATVVVAEHGADDGAQKINRVGLGRIGRQLEQVDYELAEVERRVELLTANNDERRKLLQKRALLLYRLSQGGAMRLLVESENDAEALERAGMVRWLARHTHQELAEDRTESTLLIAERESLTEERARLAVFEQHAWREANDDKNSTSCTGLPARQESVAWPTHGPIVVEREDLNARFGVMIAAAPREAVRALAAGRVIFRGTIAGLGQSVVIDHGCEDYFLFGQLRNVAVAEGTRITTGDTIGQASRDAENDQWSVWVSLWRRGARIDPRTWFASAP